MDYPEEQTSVEQAQLLERLVQRLTTEEAEVTRLQELLKEAEAKVRQTAETDIPELMLAMNLKEVKTMGGVKVALKEDVRVSFFASDKSKREPAFQWLEEKGHKGLVKNNVVVSLNQEQEELAKKLFQELKERDEHFNVKCEKDIHPSTLGAFLREQLREGEEVPLPLFGAYIQKKAKITR